MRHSIPQKINIATEQIPITAEGIELATSRKNELGKIDKVYSSNYLRSIQTAKCISEDVIVLENLKERIIGVAEKDFWLEQYQDYNYKNYNGESLNEVKTRMHNCIHDVIKKMKEEETILIVSHATAICSYLLNFGELEVTDSEIKRRKFIFNNNVIFDDTINPTSYFIFHFENDEICDIKFMK